MRYSYTSGYENFRKAQRCYIRSGIRQRIFFHLKIWGYTSIGIVLLAASVPSLSQPPPPLALFGFLLGCAMLGAGIFGLALWPWQLHRSYRIWNGEEDVLNLYLEVDGPILICGRPGKAESRFERAAVCRTVEDDNLILLFVGKKKFIYIPKSVGESAMNDVRTWLDLPGAPESC